MPDLAGGHWEEGWQGGKESPFPVPPSSSSSALGRAGQHRRAQPVLEELVPINHS